MVPWLPWQLVDWFHPSRNGREEPWHLALRGLEYMNDDPADVHVLYTGVHDGDDSEGAIDCLTQAWRRIVLALEEQGFVDKEELQRQRMRAGDGTLRPKLHATLLNTKLRRPETSQRQPVDARPLLEAFPRSRTIGSAAIRDIRLCIRGPFGADGFYKDAGTIEVADER